MVISRRQLLRGAALLAGGGLFGRAGATVPETVRIGLTPVFLSDQTGFIQTWRAYLEQRFGRAVTFLRRASYREIIDLLRNGKLDFAWLCGYPYVTHSDELHLVATPLYQGAPLYRSYLIVSAQNPVADSLADLRGKVFAYSDPDSNSGYLVVQRAMLELGTTPQQFFRKTFFTGSHRKVIEAVAVGLADGGAVDGYVYDALVDQEPAVTARTRVVERSRPFGFPPFIAHRRVDDATVTRFRQLLLGMSADPEGALLLRKLHIDGFEEATAENYEAIRRMVDEVRKAGLVS